MDEVAQQYSRQSVRFISVDIAQLAYSDLIKMGITSTPVIRLHTQVPRLQLLLDQCMATYVAADHSEHGMTICGPCR